MTGLLRNTGNPALSTLRVLWCRVFTGHKRVVFDPERGALHCCCGQRWTPPVVRDFPP